MNVVIRDNLRSKLVVFSDGFTKKLNDRKLSMRASREKQYIDSETSFVLQYLDTCQRHKSLLQSG